MLQRERVRESERERERERVRERERERERGWGCFSHENSIFVHHPCSLFEWHPIRSMY